MNRRFDAVSSVRVQRKRSRNRMVAYVRVHATERKKEREREKDGTNECERVWVKMRAWNEKKKRRESSYSERRKNNVLSETGATYYLSKYSKYMYINIYKSARTRPR